MPRRDILVIGTSAGGVEALQTLVAGFHLGVEAAIFVVLHIGSSARGRSYLPEILTRAGPLTAAHPADGELIRNGRIYIAPPDHHLLLSTGHMHLSQGPKENRTRPAINPLFRSAANTYGGRVTGIILTGTLDDGVAGLAEIKRRGGVAIAQDPKTALFPNMPLHAIKLVDVDYVTPLREIAALASKLATMDGDATERDEPMERLASGLTCPECRGPLVEERQGRIVEYRCRVGHAYSPIAMIEEHRETVERSLWASVVALEEAADIAEQLGSELGTQSSDEAKINRNQAKALKEILRQR
jgi:two-component system, chemotaxis family, protein-glutamate methylesterase/glutaminase